VKITIESTSQLGTCNDVPARIWQGTTESGIPVIAFITRIGVPDGHDPSEFERELIEPPTTVAPEPDKSQRERTQEGLVAVLEGCGFDFGVLVSLVRHQDGRSRVECAVSGTAPAELGPVVGKLLRAAADSVERDMNAQSAKFSRGLS
jgi:hypothetical protein